MLLIRATFSLIFVTLYYSFPVMHPTKKDSQIPVSFWYLMGMWVGEPWEAVGCQGKLTIFMIF